MSMAYGDKLMSILAVSLFFLSGCQKESGKELILFDFESDKELDQLYWSCHTLYALSSDHATHGSKSLKLEIYPSDYPGLTPMLAVKDWHGYEEFSLDVFNPSGKKMRVEVRIDDRQNFPDYNDRYNKSFVVKPGKNRISIPLETLVTSGTNRQLDLTHIDRLFIFMGRPEKQITLYIDSIKVSRRKI